MKQINASAQRIEYIDFIKGLAIFLVVWGHSIQNFGNADTSFFDNPIHILICSFHMPIFMVVSGFFFYKSMQQPLGKLFINKLRQLMLPIFSWSVILACLSIGHQIQTEGIDSVSITNQIYRILYGSVTNFWFIRSVFICYILTAISKRIFSKDYIACIVSILLFLAFTDNFRLALDKYMFPFFWMGYFLQKYANILNKYKKIILTGAVIFWMILLFFWEKKYYIYITGCAFYHIENFRFISENFLPRLHIVLFRYSIGFTGSLFFFYTAQIIYRKFLSFIAQIGRKTLGIYIIHIILMGYLIPYLRCTNCNFYLFNFIYTPLIALLLIGVSLFINYLIEKNRFTKMFLLGGR